jgi:hypothetical protein
MAIKLVFHVISLYTIIVGEVEQNIVICQWRANQLFDLRATDKSDILGLSSSIIVLSFAYSFSRFCSMCDNNV